MQNFTKTEREYFEQILTRKLTVFNKKRDDGVFPDEIIIDCDVNIHELDPFDILLRLILNAQRQPLLNQIHFWSVELITPKEKDKKSQKKFNRNEIQIFLS